MAVPSFPKQVHKRGYAQAQVLCDAFVQITGLPQATGALRRIRHAASQVGKTRDERKKQIVGAFVIHDAQTVRDKTVTAD